MSWIIQERDGAWKAGPPVRRNYLISSAADISNPPADNQYIAPGSVAYTADLQDMYIKSPEGVWTKVGE